MASRYRWIWLPTLGVLAAAVLLALLQRPSGGSAPDRLGVDALTAQSPSRTNALLVHRFDAERLLIGADGGAYESLDGGRSWARSGLDGRKVVTLARLKDGSVWAGGRGFLARSSNGGRSWIDVRPRGLPSLDVRALSGSRDVDGRLEAAIGGDGLFRSSDSGRTFEKLGVSSRVGSEARALVETGDGVIFVSDERLGIVVNGNGDGADWIAVLRNVASALAANYSDQHNALLLLGTAEGVLRTTDKGQTWAKVLRLESGAGAVGFAQSRISLAHAVAGDGTIYRSSDFGVTWTPVA